MSETSKKVSDAIKPALATAISGQAYLALTAIPGFGWVFALPVVRQVTQYILDRVSQWLVTETAVGLSLLWIMLEMSYEVNSAEDAREKLREMLENPAKFTEKQMREIEEHFDETTIDLIQLGIKRL